MDDLKHPFKPLSYKGNIIIGIIQVCVFFLSLAFDPHHWLLPSLFLLNGIISIWSGIVGKKKSQQNKDTK